VTRAEIRHDDIEVGDWLDGPFLSNGHGRVTDIRPYRCSPLCLRCQGGQCPDREGWRYLVFQDGAEITITPGGYWPGS
jgi:hypothetical protein